MLRKGPVPLVVHGALEYLTGVLFIASSYLFDFEVTMAKSVSIAVGVVVLVVAAVCRCTPGIID